MTLYLISFLRIDLGFLPTTDVYVTWWGQKRPLYALVFMRLYQSMTIMGTEVNKLSYPLYEAGIAEIFTNYCVFYMLYYGRKKKFRIVGIVFFVITSFLTFSLIGIITLFVILALYFIRTKRVISILFFIAIAFFVCSYFIIEKLDSSSYNERTNDYNYIFKIIIDNFPFGIGLGNLESVQDYSSSDTSVGFYSGLFSPLAYIGVFSVVYYYGLIKCLVNMLNERGFFGRLSFSILIILALLTQPIAFISIMNVIIINGLYCNRNARITVPEKIGMNSGLKEKMEE